MRWCRPSTTTSGASTHRVPAGPSPIRSATSPTSTASRPWPSRTRQGFAASRDELMAAALAGGTAAEDFTLGRLPRHGRARARRRLAGQPRLLARAAATLTDGDRVEWYGPSMGAKSFLTARLMETWAHGQDVLDAARSRVSTRRASPPTGFATSRSSV
jgi:hypothetical protein